MKRFLFIISFLFVGSAWATPRNGWPDTPNKIFQNDMDLHDEIVAHESGRIIQSSFTAVSSATATNGTTFVATGLKITLPSHSQNSKFIIRADGNMKISNINNDFCETALFRNGSNLTLGGGNNYMQIYTAGTVATTPSFSFQGPFSIAGYQDVPNTSSSLVYEMYVRTSAAGATCTFCSGGECHMLVEEIGR